MLLGYGLTGHQSMQCMAVLFSKHGRSGKSVLTAVLAAVLGDVLTAQLAANTVTQPAHQASPQAHTAHLEPLRTARLAFAPETLRGARLDAGFVKAVTGEDSISSRAPFGSSTRAFRVAALLLLATNELPVLPPNDPALRDRLRVVPFPCYFVGDSGGSVPLGGVVVRPRKADVKADLCAEAAGVLSAACAGTFPPPDFPGVAAPAFSASACCCCCCWRSRALSLRRALSFSSCALFRNSLYSSSKFAPIIVIGKERTTRPQNIVRTAMTLPIGVTGTWSP